jgi:hypothetical protein
MKINEFVCTLGTDPEVFVKGSDGKIIPSWKFLPGKKDPIGWVEAWYGGRVNIYSDGFQAETSNSPTTCIVELSKRIWEALREIERKAKALDSGAKLTLENTPMIDPEVLQNESLENIILGCEPSYNAYGNMGEFPGDPRILLHRFAGGHAHVGNKTLMNKFREVVKMFDKVLGVYFVGAAANFDNPIRRRYYGQAGEHRLPEHGLEYRTLSNCWLTHPGVMHLMFDLLRGSMAAVEEGMSEAFVCGDELAVETINNCDVPMARQIITANADMLKAILASGIRATVYTEALGDEMILMGLHGFEHLIKDPENINKNWNLEGQFAKKGAPHSWQTLIRNYQASNMRPL